MGGFNTSPEKRKKKSPNSLLSHGKKTSYILSVGREKKSVCWQILETICLIVSAKWQNPFIHCLQPVGFVQRMDKTVVIAQTICREHADWRKSHRKDITALYSCREPGLCREHCFSISPMCCSSHWIRMQGMNLVPHSPAMSTLHLGLLKNTFF